MKFRLWDEETKAFVTFKEARQSKKMPAPVIKGDILKKMHNWCKLFLTLEGACCHLQDATVS